MIFCKNGQCYASELFTSGHANYDNILVISLKTCVNAWIRSRAHPLYPFLHIHIHKHIRIRPRPDAQ